MEQVEKVREYLYASIESSDDPKSVLRSKELKSLYALITQQPAESRASFGQAVNQLKKDLEAKIELKLSGAGQNMASPIDVTAPFDENSELPELLPTDLGSQHPITTEMAKSAEIFGKMGFEISPSREIDDDFRMFTSLNFPENHPARDDYDTFMTEEDLIAPAHTSTMQNRVIQARKDQLEAGQPIAVIAMDRVFRNEDLDARHEHTFHQCEGVYVGKNITVGNLVATLKLFLSSYYQKEIEAKITPFYFPFTEPSFEFSLSCPFCGDDQDCKICSNDRWIELLGCGMVHPNVLKMAGLDPSIYTGFAWGVGVERLVMMKYGIEDVRHFNSAKLAFLRQFV